MLINETNNDTELSTLRFMVGLTLKNLSYLILINNLNY